MFDKLKKAFGGSNEEEIAPKVEEKVEAAPETPVETAPAEETKAASAKPRIGYIHLSGCTGDAMSLTENYDILSTVLTDMIDIVYGQTLVDKWVHGTYAEEMPEMRANLQPTHSPPQTPLPLLSSPPFLMECMSAQ